MSRAPQGEVRRAFEELKREIEQEPCIIYSTTTCPWCHHAENFLEKMQVQCRKIDLDISRTNQLKSIVLAEHTKQRTVPNIFIMGMHIGGFDTLQTLVEQCKRHSIDEYMQPACDFLLKKNGEGSSC